jgi:hypothetical protein
MTTESALLIVEAVGLILVPAAVGFVGWLVHNAVQQKSVVGMHRRFDHIESVVNDMRDAMLRNGILDAPTQVVQRSPQSRSGMRPLSPEEFEARRRRDEE